MVCFEHRSARLSCTPQALPANPPSAFERIHEILGIHALASFAAMRQNAGIACKRGFYNLLKSRAVAAVVFNACSYDGVEDGRVMRTLLIQRTQGLLACVALKDRASCVCDAKRRFHHRRFVDAFVKLDVFDDGENLYDSMEYRKAFMNYVMRGTSIPEKFKNAAAVTKTGDIGAVISPTVVNRIVEKMETIGMILPLVTKTAFAAGAVVPKSTVKPVATWVAEGGTSDTQKKGVTNIDIKGYKLRCAIAMTLEASVMSLQIFETVFVNNVAEAMVKAQEKSFIDGSGSGQPKGVLKVTVPTGQTIDIPADGKLTYEILTKAEGALPLAKEANAVWNMTKKTFMGFVGMVDGNGQPIARVNYGLDGKPERYLLGRKVVLNEYMVSLGAEVQADTPVAFIMDWSDYMFNTNYQMTVKTYEDNDTEDQVTKAVMICDGKAVDVDSLVVLMLKKAGG